MSVTTRFEQCDFNFPENVPFSLKCEKECDYILRNRCVSKAMKTSASLPEYHLELDGC